MRVLNISVIDHRVAIAEFELGTAIQMASG